MSPSPSPPPPQSVLKGIASGSTSESLKQKAAFVAALQKALTNKTLADMAAACGVETAEACSYVDPKETTVYRYYVTAVQAPLQDLLFNHRELFIHNTASQAAGIPMFSDLKVMVNCFTAHYHVNHRNSHLTHVCLDPASPPVFRLALVKAVMEVLNPKYSPPWWPARATLHPLSSQLRALFQVRKPCLASLLVRLAAAVSGSPCAPPPGPTAAAEAPRPLCTQPAGRESILPECYHGNHNAQFQAES